MTDKNDKIPEKTELPFTHEVVLTVRSNEDDPDCSFRVEWKPDISGEEYKAMGYQPTSHIFAEQWLLPMLERAYMSNVHPELLEPIEGKPN